MVVGRDSHAKKGWWEFHIEGTILGLIGYAILSSWRYCLRVGKNQQRFSVCENVVDWLIVCHVGHRQFTRNVVFGLLARI